ncbi:MAG TPA: hypothetical protein VFC01_34965 [Mycobacterium sp.]|nr:hypothetical protein [Mycobacterium sp.]
MTDKDRQDTQRWHRLVAMGTNGVLVGALLAIGTVTASILAQDTGPPIAGVTGSLGLEGTMDKFYGGANTAIVKTADGVRHLLHLTNRTSVHGGKVAADSFSKLEEGSQVVVHYVVEGDRKTALEVDRVGEGGLPAVEGTVTYVDRRAKRLTVRLADGTALALRLTDRAAQDDGKDVDNGSQVIVYYADDSAEWVAHYFRKVR